MMNMFLTCMPNPDFPLDMERMGTDPAGSNVLLAAKCNQVFGFGGGPPDLTSMGGMGEYFEETFARKSMQSAAQHALSFHPGSSVKEGEDVASAARRVAAEALAIDECCPAAYLLLARYAGSFAAAEAHCNDVESSAAHMMPPGTAERLSFDQVLANGRVFMCQPLRPLYHALQTKIHVLIMQERYEEAFAENKRLLEWDGGPHKGMSTWANPRKDLLFLATMSMRPDKGDGARDQALAFATSTAEVFTDCYLYKSSCLDWAWDRCLLDFKLGHTGCNVFHAYSSEEHLHEICYAKNKGGAIWAALHRYPLVAMYLFGVWKLPSDVKVPRTKSGDNRSHVAAATYCHNKMKAWVACDGALAWVRRHYNTYVLFCVFQNLNLGRPFPNPEKMSSREMVALVTEYMSPDKGGYYAWATKMHGCEGNLAYACYHGVGSGRLPGIMLSTFMPKLMEQVDGLDVPMDPSNNPKIQENEEATRRTSNTSPSGCVIIGGSAKTPGSSECSGHDAITHDPLDALHVAFVTPDGNTRLCYNISTLDRIRTAEDGFLKQPAHFRTRMCAEDEAIILRSFPHLEKQVAASVPEAASHRPGPIPQELMDAYHQTWSRIEEYSKARFEKEKEAEAAMFAEAAETARAQVGGDAKAHDNTKHLHGMSMTFREGDEVIIRGLTSTAGQALNGCVAEIITGVVQEDDRLACKIIPNAPSAGEEKQKPPTKLIKMSNLVRKPFGLRKQVFFDFPPLPADAPPYPSLVAAGKHDSFVTAHAVLTPAELHGQIGAIANEVPLPPTNGPARLGPTYIVQYKRNRYQVYSDQLKVPRNSGFTAAEAAELGSVQRRCRDLMNAVRKGTRESREQVAKLCVSITQGANQEGRTEAMVILNRSLPELVQLVHEPEYDFALGVHSTISEHEFIRAESALNVLNQIVGWPITRFKMQRQCHADDSLPDAVRRLILMYPVCLKMRNALNPGLMNLAAMVALNAIRLVWALVCMPLRTVTPSRWRKVIGAYLEDRGVRNVMKAVSRGVAPEHESFDSASITGLADEACSMHDLIRFPDARLEMHMRMAASRMTSRARNVVACCAPNCFNAEEYDSVRSGMTPLLFQKCGRCSARYCSKDCQRYDWKYGDHAEVCGGGGRISAATSNGKSKKGKKKKKKKKKR
eukprot:g480.t1